MFKFIRWNRLFIVSTIILILYTISKFHLWKQTLILLGQFLGGVVSLGILYFFVLLPIWGIIKFFIRWPEKNIIEAQTTIKEEPDFYSTRAWKELRYIVLSNNPRKCMLCGRRGKSLHVDHIKPRSLHPELALDIDNLQILCAECNMGKSNKHEHDFRPYHTC